MKHLKNYFIHEDIEDEKKPELEAENTGTSFKYILNLKPELFFSSPCAGYYRTLKSKSGATMK
jgi:hypothetical protein